MLKDGYKSNCFLTKQILTHALRGQYLRRSHFFKYKKGWVGYDALTDEVFWTNDFFEESFETLLKVYSDFNPQVKDTFDEKPLFEYSKYSTQSNVDDTLLRKSRILKPVDENCLYKPVYYTVATPTKFIYLGQAKDRFFICHSKAILKEDTHEIFHTKPQYLARIPEIDYGDGGNYE